MKSIAFVIGVAALAFCTTSHAESLRCNGDLAQIGDSKASVIQKCGLPFFTESFCKPAGEVASPYGSYGGTTITIAPCELVDEWSYNPGPGQFITILRFEAGVMTSMRYGDRVK
jgi:hypothetical protein